MNRRAAEDGLDLTRTDQSSAQPGVDLDLTDSYDYELPAALIATTPAAQRDQSRLMVLRDGQGPDQRAFAEIGGVLRPGDLLVRNAVGVIPARLLGRKPTGGAVELLVLEPVGGSWTEPMPTLRALALGRASKPIREGKLITLTDGAAVRVLRRGAEGLLELDMGKSGVLSEWLDAHGVMPLPPYIRRPRQARHESVDRALDRRRYQTVYAREPGAVAAPTAGLHFSARLLQELRDRGVDWVDVSLDVSAGTFRPIETERLSELTLHRERYRITPKAAETINACRSNDRRSDRRFDHD